MKTTIKQVKGPCRICEAESSGFNFGVLTCKPCASFFRRCIAERKKYICRSGNACGVTGQQQRQSCRACRLRICMEVGMSRDLSSNAPICAVPSAPSSPTNTIMTEHSPVMPTSSSSLNNGNNLNWMLSVWRNFQMSQRALLAVVHPEYASMSSIREPLEDYRFVMKAEYERIEMGSVSLLMTLLHDNYPAFKALNETIKNTVYRRYNVRFAFLQRIFLTSKVFPLDDDDRLVFFAGVYCTVRDLGIFYGEDSQSQLVLNVQRAAKAMYDKALHNKRKFVKHNVREIEAAYLAAALLYDVLADEDQLTSEATAHLKLLRCELFDNMVENYDRDEAISRFAQINYFISDINKTCVHSTESMILINMMLPVTKSVNTWTTMDDSGVFCPS